MAAPYTSLNISWCRRISAYWKGVRVFGKIPAAMVEAVFAQIVLSSLTVIIRRPWKLHMRFRGKAERRFGRGANWSILPSHSRVRVRIVNDKTSEKVVERKEKTNNWTNKTARDGTEKRKFRRCVYIYVYVCVLFFSVISPPFAVSSAFLSCLSLCSLDLRLTQFNMSLISRMYYRAYTCRSGSSGHIVKTLKKIRVNDFRTSCDCSFIVRLYVIELTYCEVIRVQIQLPFPPPLPLRLC